MSKSSNLWDANPRISKNSLLWDKLYSFLVVRVRYWVYSARLSFWHGKEEEIVGDIIQDAIVGTLTYVLEFSQGMSEKETIFSKSLLRFSVTLAYRQYRLQENRDGQFVTTRRGHYQEQGFFVVARDEGVGWQESAIDRTFQEWFCECLAGTIVAIPSRARIALLTHWANHLCYESRQAQTLVHALSQRAVSLLEFQHSLPEDPQEKSKHKALIRFAYGQIMKEPERKRHVFSGATDCLLPVSPEVENVKLNRELIVLGAHLEATASSPSPRLVFCEELRDNLLDLMVEHQIAGAVALPVHKGDELFPLSQSGDVETENRCDEQLSPNLFSSNESGDDEIDDSEVGVLAEFLRGMTSLAQIDPVFQANLRQKFLGLPRMYAALQTEKPVEHVLAETERLLEQLPNQDYSLTSETGDAGPDQLSLEWLQKPVSQSEYTESVRPPGND